MLITSRVFWGASVSLLLLLLLLLLYRKFFFEKGHTLHIVLLALYAMYLGALFSLILFPTYMLRPFHFSTQHVNLIPFKAIDRLRTDPAELIGNAVLFLPFGFFSVLNDRKKAGGRIFNVLWRTMLLSTILELMQMFIGRVTDIDDVILNTLSGLLGAVLCVVWHKSRLDHTPIGEKLMPELPKQWRGKLAVPLLSFVVLVIYGGCLLTVNTLLTRNNGRPHTVSVNGQTIPFTLEARNAMLWDRTDERMLFGSEVDTAIYPASTIALAVCLTAADIVPPDESVTVGTEILRRHMDYSAAGIRMGETYTVRELLAGVLLSSGADACYTLGVHCGRVLLHAPDASDADALDAFLAAANEKVQSLGAVHTTLRSVIGLDDAGQLTTVRDLCLIASAVLDHPLLSQLCATAEMDIGPENDPVHLHNTNLLVCPDSDFYTEAFVGIKTGSTSLAGNCLIGAFSQDGRSYITIAMHSGYDGKYTDTLTLAGLVHGR